MDNIREKHENKKDISDKIIKDLKNNKETRMNQIEGQERLLILQNFITLGQLLLGEKYMTQK